VLCCAVLCCAVLCCAVQALHEFGGYVMDANVLIEAHLLFKVIMHMHSNKLVAVADPHRGSQTQGLVMM
jgi:hypothetical protein